ncbi:MAG: hypothetical protein KF753_04560 [Caldilineaceae bacterium]|nr:hypothetical protein [Caldilineaceae bacterium]
MRYEIVVTKQVNNGYTARPVLFPEVVVTGADEQETLERVRAAIVDLQSTSRIVAIDVPLKSETTPVDPWLEFAGMWADEANWETFQEEVAAYRHSIDEQEHLEEPLADNG